MAQIDVTKEQLEALESIPSRRESSLLIDPETEALLKVGFFKWSDFIFLLSIVSGILVTALWLAFAGPDPIKIVCAFLMLILTAIIWTITLVFRVSYFILKLTGLVHLMPESAARIAVEFHKQNLSSAPTATSISAKAL